MTAVLLDCLVLLPLLLTGWPVCPLDALLALDWLRQWPWLSASEIESYTAMMTSDVEQVMCTCNSKITTSCAQPIKRSNMLASSKTANYNNCKCQYELRKALHAPSRNW